MVNPILRRNHMQQQSYKAVFFDLDGTLTPLDQDEFLRRYFVSLEAFAVRYSLDGSRFSTSLNKGVKAMITGPTDVTNDKKFWDCFMQDYGDVEKSREEIEDLLQRFYEVDFGTLGRGVVPNPDAAYVVKTLQDKGYKLFLTTMPLFPLIAVEWRMKWGGIDPALFSRITTYDNSYTAKPNLEYYRQNIELAGCAPEEILMVGNNAREDMAATQLGCDGYLVTDGLLNPENVDINQFRNGTMAQFRAFVDSLPECEAWQ